MAGIEVAKGVRLSEEEINKLVDSIVSISIINATVPDVACLEIFKIMQLDEKAEKELSIKIHNRLWDMRDRLPWEVMAPAA